MNTFCAEGTKCLAVLVEADKFGPVCADSVIYRTPGNESRPQFVVDISDEQRKGEPAGRKAAVAHGDRKLGVRVAVAGRVPR